MIQEKLFDTFGQYVSTRKEARDRFFQAAKAIKHLFPIELLMGVNRASQKMQLSIRLGVITTRYGGYLHLKTPRGGLLDYDRPFGEQFAYHNGQ